MKMSFHSLANETYFDIKGFAPDLALKQRLKATRKWPIALSLLAAQELGLRSFNYLPEKI